jgi:Mrp family chromosome partitioning ATPase
VSLIESTLEKLRGVGEPAVQGALAPPRTVNAAASPTKAALVAVSPARAYIHRRVAVDRKALRNAGYLPAEGLERRFADHYRQIKRAFIDKAVSGGADMRSILISSALPGDGKTFTSLNLALSIARERDFSVLLVDADVPRARISEVLGLRGERGLVDALADESLDVESLIMRTDVRGFEVLPAGNFVESAPELLASSRMDQVAAHLSARDPRGLVVFDSAPLLVSSEARALLRVPGQVALVVRLGITPRQAALDAAACLEKRKFQGLILNEVAFIEASNYYGYAPYGESRDETHGTRQELRGASPALRAAEGAFAAAKTMARAFMNVLQKRT